MKERMAFYRNLAAVLRRHREKTGMTVTSVAKMSGLTPAIIKEIESGDAVIEVYEFTKVMELYEKFNNEKTSHS